jgi:hypothetical protein
VAARSAKVEKITDGGGTNRPLDSPILTVNSHIAASPRGTTRPSAGHKKRVTPGLRVTRARSAAVSKEIVTGE